MSAPAKSPRLTRSHPRSRCAVNWSIGPRLPMIERNVRAQAARSSGLPGAFGLLSLWLVACGLAPIARDATSLGSANKGALLTGQALPTSGLGFVRARPEDDTRYGVPLLIEALQRAAASVQHTF